MKKELTKEQIEKNKKYDAFMEKQKTNPSRHSKEWREWRKELLLKTPACEACGETKALSIHHKERHKPDDPYIGCARDRILILCKRCHFGIHHYIGYCIKCDHMTPGSIFDKTLICKRHPESKLYKRNEYMRRFYQDMDNDEDYIDAVIDHQQGKPTLAQQKLINLRERIQQEI